MTGDRVRSVVCVGGGEWCEVRETKRVACETVLFVLHATRRVWWLSAVGSVRWCG